MVPGPGRTADSGAVTVGAGSVPPPGTASGPRATRGHAPRRPLSLDRDGPLFFHARRPPSTDIAIPVT